MDALKNEVDWCRVCQTQHPADACPGYVELSGPALPGRRFSARRDGRTEQYQTLVAQAGEHWQATIVTVPNRMWGAPCGGGTAKFLDVSAEEVERKAVRFIYTRCASLQVEVKELRSGADEPVDSPLTGRGTDGKFRQQELPALFGVERPMWPAKASQLSRDGLFLASAHTELVGTRVIVKMQLEHVHTPLAGVVVRVNIIATAMEPIGIELELEAPPFAYCEYVDSLEHALAE